MRVLQSIAFLIILVAGLAWAFGRHILNGVVAILSFAHLQSAPIADWQEQLDRFQDGAERWISAHPNLGWILIVFAGSLLLALHGWPAMVRRRKVPALEIAYDNSDPRFVRRKIDIGPTGLDGGEYHAVAIRNNSGNRTLHDVFVVAEGGEFVRSALWVSHGGEDATLMPETDLHPGATEWVELFGFGNNIGEIDCHETVWRRAQRFCIRARARDAKESVAEFEYDPRLVPVIRRIR
jgi:hypothetical protein